MEFDTKKGLVKKVQAFLNLKDDGIDGPNTWNSIIKALNISEVVKQEGNSEEISISKSAFNLIIKYEVGGGESYYTKFLQKPTWPQGQSGVTIGIGYDLGYNDLNEFTKDWKNKIKDSEFERLSKTLGKKSQSAAVLVSNLKDILIPWDSALSVFKSNTLPRFIKQTLNAFPNADKLHPDAFGALVSIVFNRGPSVAGISRIEMLNIRNLIASKNYEAIANEVRKMKRLWINKGLDGLLTRREEEAKLIESCF